MKSVVMICALLAASSIGGCAAGPEVVDESALMVEPLIDTPTSSGKVPDAPRPLIDFHPRILYDSGWRTTTTTPQPRDYRFRIYASDATPKLAFVVYGHIGGGDGKGGGARFPRAELRAGPLERCDFDDSTTPIDLRSGFAWVRFAPPPATRNTAALAPAADFRLFSTRSFYIHPVGTEFVLATSEPSRFDLVGVTSPGSVEVAQRFLPEPARQTITQSRIVRRGLGNEPTLNIEPLLPGRAPHEMVADAVDIAGAAIAAYNNLPAAARPTAPLNPPATLFTSPTQPQGPATSNAELGLPDPPSLR